MVPSNSPNISILENEVLDDEEPENPENEEFDPLQQIFPKDDPLNLSGSKPPNEDHP